MPFDHWPKMPEASQARITSSMKGSLLGELVPHELFTMCGRFAAFGLEPLSLVGASIHWPDSISPALLWQHPFAVIHFALGATPIWFTPPSSPTMVPIVWVP